MKVIICGSRNIHDMQWLEEAIVSSGFNITEVVCGLAQGADTLGRRWAESRLIPVKPFPAKWKDLSVDSALIKTGKDGQRYNARAGQQRNEAMAQYADACIALWDGYSPGTEHMIRMAKFWRLPVYLEVIRKEE
jgi:hypothetical protein